MYGIALEGGGARGAYQIGAWKALRELGIKYNGVVGTSVGALNGILMIQNDFDKAYDLWNNLSFSKVMSVSDEVIEKLLNYEFSSENIKEYKNEFKKAFGFDGFDIGPFKNNIKEFLNENMVRGSGKDYGLVTVSLSDMKGLELFIEDIPKGFLHEYLLASCYLPIFKTERLNGKLYTDGAYFNNLPTRMLVKKGYKNIIEIRLKDKAVQHPVNEENLNIIKIIPKENLGRSLEFDQSRIRNNIRLGYFDTLRVFNGYKGNKYYINMPYTESEVVNYLAGLENNQNIKLNKLVRYNNVPSPRVLFEEIIPKLAKTIDLEDGWNYTDFVIGVFEYFAHHLKMERFNIYDFDEFIEKISLNVNNIEINNFGFFDRIMKVDENIKVLKEFISRKENLQ